MALDAKMAINEQMNIILEAIANAIFKHWFVDFEFPNEEAKPYKSSGGRFSDSILGKIPTGWEMTSLDQVAELTMGFSYKGSEKSKGGGEYLFVTLNSVKEGGGFKREFSFISSDRLKERHFVQSGDIVIANTEQTKTGTLLGYPALVEFPFGYKGDRAVISHHITKVVPKQPSLKYFLYYYLLFHQQKAVHYNTGSVIWALDVLNWAGQERVSIPPPKLIDSFNQLVDPIMRRFWENNLHTEILAGLRDAMLPKLISGKIRIQVEAS
jgi:type I restriction enzyme S subunit